MTEQPTEPRSGDDERTQLAAYVKAPKADAFAAECQNVAVDLVDHHIGPRKVPDVVRWAAVLEVGADMYHRRSARNGLATFGNDGEISTARIRTDPLAAARPILAPYLGAPIA